jgi:N-terminal domain of toast_rack, DUF2154
MSDCRNRIANARGRGTKPGPWRTAAVLAGCVLLMLGAAGCTVSNGPAVGETYTISKSVPLGQQKSVAVDIKMGAGKLRVGGGTTDLMNADFTYNVDAWKPEIRYEANGDQGHLIIQQPTASHNYRGRTRYDWDVRLNAQIPMEMNVNMGAGNANLVLAGLNLSQLKVNMGAGEADIDLDGRWTHDLEASVQGGVGKAVLHLPRDVGVRATVQGGLGTIQASELSKNGDVYTNSAFGKSPVNLNIQVHGGIGEVDLVLGGGQGTI